MIKDNNSLTNHWREQVVWNIFKYEYIVTLIINWSLFCLILTQKHVDTEGQKTLEIVIVVKVLAFFLQFIWY